MPGSGNSGMNEKAVAPAYKEFTTGGWETDTSETHDAARWEVQRMGILASGATVFCFYQHSTQDVVGLL